MFRSNTKESFMKKIMLSLGFLAVLGLAQGGSIAADHPELTEADEAYSAENFAKAAELYRKDAELGVIVAQVNLAFMYLDGIGLTQDYGQAAQWFQKAAQQGNREAQSNLGVLLKEGKGVAQNPVEADKWFILAGDKTNQAAIEKTLSPEQTAQAKQLAEQWTVEYKKARGR